MTTYRFRVKYEHDPTSLWRDIVVGADCTLSEFQSVLNSAVGLNQDHLWFFGTDQDYWDSEVQYKRPGEIEQSPAGCDEAVKRTTPARRRSARWFAS